MFITLIESQTDAVAFGGSKELIIDNGHIYSIAATNVTGEERVYVQFSVDNGKTWQNYREDGIIVGLIAEQPHWLFEAPGIYRFSKDATTNPCAVVAGRYYHDYKGGVR